MVARSPNAKPDRQTAAALAAAAALNPALVRETLKKVRAESIDLIGFAVENDSVPRMMRRWTGAWRGFKSCSTRRPAALRSSLAFASAHAARAGTSAQACDASRRLPGKSSAPLGALLAIRFDLTQKRILPAAG
jgi:hypothetical protein